MKQIFRYIIILLVILSASSCQQEDIDSNVGYLRVEVGTNSYVSTRIADEYNPKQIALQIINSKGEIVTSTDDWETLAGTQLRLPAGTYTLNASSNGFDGSESGYDIPYYAGSEQVTVQTGKEVTANIVCTLANVKVTVNYDESFQQFKTATTEVASALEGVAELNFTMNEELKPGYFPVGDLTVTVNVTNNAGQSHSQTTNITDVKARKHYILNFKVAEVGSIEKPTVTINGEEIVYSFTFNVSTEASTKLEAKAANAWSNFAYVEGSIASSAEELDLTYMRFEYKTVDAEQWQTCSATYDSENEKFTATLTDLTPATQYSYRLAYEKGGDTYASDAITFTTEDATELHNGNLDTWTQSESTWYPGFSEEAGNTTCFWNTSNPGTSQGLGAIGGAVNPTQGVTSPVNTAGGKAAELKSTEKANVFAAASLYTGNFLELVVTSMSAKMEFGKPFSSRPSALHGFYKYTPAVINIVDRVPDGVSITKGETLDQCAIFIALATKNFTFNNKNEDEYIDYANDPAIIAYGELPSGAATSGEDYTEFNIPLVYRNLTDKPTHIIIVCSASKYGDYMTGGVGSTMYIDDLELVYDQPTVQE